MRFLVTVGLALIISSCQVDYEDNSRLLFKGSVNDSLQNPFPGVPVTVYASPNPLVLITTESIGTGITDADGTFEIVTLSPKNPTFLEVHVNDFLQEKNNPEFGSYTFRRIDVLGENEATYNIPEFTLEKRVNTALEIKRVSNVADSLSFRYRYKNSDRIVDFSQKATPDILEDPNLLVGSGILPSTQNDTIVPLFGLVANDTLFLKYRLINGTVSDAMETELLYNPETGSYEFEF